MNPYNDVQTKKTQVRLMFDTIAPHYDLLNHLLSFDFDRLWRRKLVRLVAVSKPSRVLDVATGTADVAINVARRLPECSVVGVDLSDEMVRFGRVKVQQADMESRIVLMTGDAENLAFDDASFDAVTASFGVRNFGDLPKGVSEMCRVLSPGGRCCIMEFSSPSENTLFATLYRFYFHKILPLIGGLISKDRKAYGYLPRSVDEFPRREDFEAMMLGGGFTKVESVRLMWGVAYIYIGTK